MSSVDTQGLINRKDGDINDYTASINQDILAIKGMMQIDKSNGLDGITLSSKDLLEADGLINPDANFFDIYYDESGKPYFLFNQFNPLFSHFEGRNGGRVRDNACSYAAGANAFIMANGVHSLVDSFGIIMYYVDYAQDTKGPITGSDWLKVMRGKDSKNSPNFHFLEKYMYDENGDLKFEVHEKIGETRTAMDAAISSGQEEAEFIYLGSYADRNQIQSLIDQAESAGYDVEVNCAGVNAGNFGGNHYISAHYDTENGVKVMDSYGSRASSEDIQTGNVLMWTDGNEYKYKSNEVFKKGVTRLTTTVFDTHRSGPGAFKDFLEIDNAGGSGEPVYIRITKRQ